MKTQGISKKIVADLLTSAVAFAIAYFGVELDPTVSAGLAKAIGFVAGYFAPANPVVVRDESGQAAPLTLLIYALVIVILVLLVLFLAERV